MKTCTKCKIEKSNLEFNKDNRQEDGLQCWCRECAKLWRSNNVVKILDSKRAYREKNKEKLSLGSKERYLKNREIILIRRREKYAENRDLLIERERAYRERNKEEISKKARGRYSANPQIKKERQQKYRKKNPEKIAERDRNRRARSLRAEGSHTNKDIASIFERQRGLCVSCESVLIKSGSGKMHVDHIMPLYLGGSNWPNNIQLLCPSCNASKGAMHPLDWAARQGRLL